MLPKDQKAIISAAKAGGKIAKSHFGRILNVEEKSCGADFRTQADTESESAIIAILEKAFPAYNIFSEERGFIDKKSECTFYIDPLDGTNNFFLGIPNFSVLIALVRGKETIFGLAYLPMIDVLYTAEKGGGAFCGAKRLKPSAERQLIKSTSGFICGYLCPKTYVEKAIGGLSRKSKRVLWSWSVGSDLCLVAAGKTETVVNVKTEPWDFLAAKLIAKEAGCIVTDLKGKSEKDDFNHTFVVSNNLSISRQVLRLL